jgi:hypothetical protein
MSRTEDVLKRDCVLYGARQSAEGRQRMMTSKYRLNDRDLQILAAVGRMLKRLVASESVRPAQLVTIAKVQHVLSRLPLVTEGVCATIDISWRINEEGCRATSGWQFSVGDDSLTFSCGGSEYTEGVGSDSFTTMSWSASPGERSEYDGTWDESWMGPDDQGYSEADTFRSLHECDISVEDDENSLLSEADDSDED